MRRIGLGFCAQPYTIRQICSAAQLAEQKEFESVWIAEDIWTGRDALSILTSVAMHTERVVLGTAVINIYTRHPVLTAQILNTISELAPGRLRLGIGTGMTWKPLLETQGFDLHPLRDMKNAVFTIRGLLQGERIPWDGGTLGLEVNRKCFYEALPPTKNPVPIYIGAVGPRMTELTGEIGDGLILELVVRRDVFPIRLKHLQIGAERASRNLKSLDIARLILISVSENGKIHKNALGYVAKEVVLLDETMVDKLGFDPDQLHRIREAHRTGDCEGATSLLTSDIVSTFIAAGSQEECLKFVESVVDAGVNLPILVPFGGDVNPIIEVGEEFAKRIV